MKEIFSMFKNIYTCDNKQNAHLFLVFFSLLATVFCSIDVNHLPALPLCIILTVGYILAEIYYKGFYVSFANKKWNNDDDFPEFSGAFFVNGLKLIGLKLYWTLIFLILLSLIVIPLGLLCVILIQSYNPLLPLVFFVGVVLYIFLLLLLVCVDTFIDVEFAKEFSYKGLFSLSKIGFYLKNLFGTWFVSLLKFLLFSLLLLGSVILLMTILFTICPNPTYEYYIELFMIVVYTYFSLIIGLVYINYMQKLFKNKMDEISAE